MNTKDIDLNNQQELEVQVIFPINSKILSKPKSSYQIVRLQIYKPFSGPELNLSVCNKTSLFDHGP